MTGTLAATAVLALAMGGWAPISWADDLERAIVLADEGRIEEARKVIAPLLEQQPEDIHVHLLQGILQFREGRFDDAIRVFEGLREAHPGRSEPYNNLAAVYVAQDRLDEAHAALLAATAREPALPVAHENLADLYLRLARRSSLHAHALSTASETGPGPTADTTAANGVGEESETVDASGQSPVASVDANDVAAQLATGACVRVTGFDDAADAAEAKALLRERGVDADVRQARNEVVKDHWVFHPPLPSRAEAIAKMEEMRAEGVEDLAVMRDGDQANAISLGIYRSTNNMRRRIAELEGIGYPVQYETTSEPVTTYWLKAQAPVFPAFLRADLVALLPDRPIGAIDCD